MRIKKNCRTCYHKYHKKYYKELCDHVLECQPNKNQVPPKWIPCTNGDYIRSMNDEELGRWLCDTGDCSPYCAGYSICGNGEKGTTIWLTKEMEDMP